LAKAVSVISLSFDAIKYRFFRDAPGSAGAFVQRIPTSAPLQPFLGAAAAFPSHKRVRKGPA
jgi:hypothetical protein